MKSLNARRTNRRSLIILALLLPSLAAAYGLTSGVAQSPVKDEREVEERVPKHLPVRVKVKNEQALKDLKNSKWASEVEIEVKNTGDKPIYFVNVVVAMRDVVVEGAELVLIAGYGRGRLAVPETPVEEGDVPIMPGETVTLKVAESQAKAFEQGRDEEHKWGDPKKVAIQVEVINFGDGTFMLGGDGVLRKARPRTRSSNDGTRARDGGGCRPSGERDEGSLSRGILKAFSFQPASLLRADFSPASGSRVTFLNYRRDLCGCQSVFGCEWGVLDYPECPCDNNQQFTSVSFAGGCANSGTCYSFYVARVPCSTKYNGTQTCTYDFPTGSCRIGDPPPPTPTPDPNASPTPDPSPSPSPSPAPTPVPCPTPKPADCCVPFNPPPAPGLRVDNVARRAYS